MKQQLAVVKNYPKLKTLIIIFLGICCAYDLYVSWYAVHQNQCSYALIDLMGYRVKARQSLNAFYAQQGGVLHHPRCFDDDTQSVSIAWTSKHTKMHPLAELWLNSNLHFSKSESQSYEHLFRSMKSPVSVRMQLNPRQELCFTLSQREDQTSAYCFQTMELISPINQ